MWPFFELPLGKSMLWWSDLDTNKSQLGLEHYDRYRTVIKNTLYADDRKSATEISQTTFRRRMGEKVPCLITTEIVILDHPPPRGSWRK